MAQYVALAPIGSIPQVGETRTANVYRVEAATQADAAAAAAVVFNLQDGQKIWCVLATAFAQFGLTVGTPTRTVTAE